MRRFFNYQLTLLTATILLMGASISFADNQKFVASKTISAENVVIFDSNGTALRTVRVRPSQILPDANAASSSSSTDISCAAEDQAHYQELAMRSFSVRGVRPSPVEAWRKLDLLIVASPDFTAAKGETEIASEILQTVSVANRYLRDLKVSINLVGIQLVPGDPNAGPYSEAISQGDGFKMLQAVRREWSERAFPNRDATVVFASSRFRDTFGLAYTGATCIAPQSSYLFVTKGGIEKSVGFGATLAHELGHLLGMTHDGNPVGIPSLMWPTHIEHANGFSPASITQYVEHTGVGMPGGVCLDTLPAAGGETPPAASGEFQFADSPVREIVIREGERVTLPLVVRQHDSLPGVRYRAADLPIGATFDTFSGVFSFAPDFSVAHRKQPFVASATLIAEMLGSSASMIIRLQAEHVNRSPVIEGVSDEPIEIAQGATAPVLLRAVDLDEPGSIRSLKILNSRVLRKQGLRIKRQARSLLVIDASQALVNEYHLQVFAVDNERGETLKNVVLNVVPPKKRVEVSATFSAAGAIAIQFLNADSAAEADIVGVPVGTQVWFTDSGAELYSPFALAAGTLQIVSSSSEASIPFSAAVGAALQTSLPHWPGNSRHVATDAETLLYNPRSGMWSRLQCDGTMQNVAQFGGLPGDIPVAVTRGEESRPTILREVNGGLIWVTPGETPTLFGLTGDVAVSGDFNGDGDSEAAVFRPQERTWYLQISATEVVTYRVARRGSETPQQLPFVADVDGDGKDEPIVFERLKSGTTRFRVLFLDGRELLLVVAQVGPSERAVPFVSDLDRDGRGDVGVLRGGSTAEVYFSSSSMVQAIATSGSTQIGTLLCPGDPVFFSKSTDSISLRKLSSSALLSKANISPDLVSTQEFSRRRAYRLSSAVAGDFDGDRKFDLAVSRVDGADMKVLVAGSRGGAQQWNLSAEPTAQLLSWKSSASGYSQPLIFSGGIWQFLGSFDVQKIQWGQASDRSAVGDFNGDGESDLAIFRPSDGSWWIRFGLEDNSAAEVRFWGQQGDIPVVGDYDGDAVSDLAVFRPETGTWFVRTSSGSVIVQEGAADQSLPIGGDFSGFGRSEFVAWNPARAEWTSLLEDGVFTQSFGLPGDIALGGNLDGNGSDEFIVYRKGSGEWFGANTYPAGMAPLFESQWGLGSDLPAQIPLVSLF